MNTIIKAFLCSIFTFLLPIKGLMILMLFAIGIDTIVGIYTSNKTGKKFKSNKFFNIVIKTFFYLGTIILTYLVDKYIFEGVLPILHINNGLSKFTTMFWVISEIISIDENSQKLGNKPLFQMLKEYIGKAKDLKKDLNDLKDNDEDKE